MEKKGDSDMHFINIVYDIAYDIAYYIVYDIVYDVMCRAKK